MKSDVMSFLTYSVLRLGFLKRGPVQLWSLLAGQFHRCRFVRAAFAALSPRVEEQGHSSVPECLWTGVGGVVGGSPDNGKSSLRPMEILLLSLFSRGRAILFIDVIFYFI